MKVFLFVLRSKLNLQDNTKAKQNFGLKINGKHNTMKTTMITLSVCQVAILCISFMIILVLIKR